ncbi:MAG: carbohydrate ABC transporter permease [Fusobacteriaceae bacterium]|nr:carbohydrate ABC transporter permease [Fusobacteriaceae bacterium]
MKINKTEKISLTFINSLICILLLSPIIYALSISFMKADEIFSTSVNFLPSSFYLGNYKEAIKTIPIFRYILNSFFIAAFSTLGQIVTSCLAAYAFSFFKFKGKSIIFIIFLSTMMIPGEAVIISNYLTISKMKLLDTYTGLIIPNLVSAMGIFMLRQYFLTVPKDLMEAAKIDGMSSFHFLIYVLIPISKSAISSLSMYTFLMTWNQYMWPLLVTGSDNMRTVQIGVSMLKANESESFGLIMAGIIMIIIPSIFLFILGQKQLIDGMSEGSLKG